MLNNYMLKSKIKVNGYKTQTVAEMLGINSATLYRKLKGITDFRRCEVFKLMKILNLSDKEVCEIFFKE